MKFIYILLKLNCNGSNCLEFTTKFFFLEKSILSLTLFRNASVGDDEKQNQSTKVLSPSTTVLNSLPAHYSHCLYPQPRRHATDGPRWVPPLISRSSQIPSPKYVSHFPSWPFQNLEYTTRILKVRRSDAFAEEKLISRKAHLILGHGSHPAFLSIRNTSAHL